MHREVTQTEQMQRLLEPLSPQWVADRVGVTRQQVDRWKNGKHVRQERLDAVAEAVRALLPEWTPAAPPEWAERLLRNVEALAQQAGITDADRAEAERVAALAAADAGLLPRSRGGRPRGHDAGAGSGP